MLCNRRSSGSWRWLRRDIKRSVELERRERMEDASYGVLVCVSRACVGAHGRHGRGRRRVCNRAKYSEWLRIRCKAEVLSFVVSFGTARAF
ncbi:hypothetical protein CONPUDRAFT_133702 [Coniophora puteana RWD-64-598 SS2]|uniref:Uncharacterized protein n=1 Tax=Coniophora puteana (strain RWD-64-598) TaxID=741705 RepID=A0A5M3N417_CONPW|nr:uncharacterized protein CONPUDRAFT_133702 [Coniophora puteana RWD-64-598 SS2]EIW86170.1 hypothetical protein CONPUDRAFT_133702 [Coniophora puteana RWD-64-598 SS2]